MKIGIDTFGCVHGRSGMGAYLVSLIPCLPKVKDVDYEIFGPEMDRYTYLSDGGWKYNSVNVPDSITAERFWHYFSLNSFGKKNEYSVILYTSGSRLLPGKFKVPGVAIVSDFISKRDGDHFYTNFIKKNLSRCSCIIASSNAVKQDLISQNVKCSDIQVVYPGIDHSLFYPREEMDGNSDILEIKPFAIKRPYIIYAASMHGPDKRHVELIKAFTLFKERTHLPHRLVIAGAEGAYGEVIHKEAFSSSASSDIFITGYFPHESFAQLYRSAEACIVPSVDDGSGLSVLEAMATGVPVACSDSGALPEVTGGNALFFDSSDVEDMASKIHRIVTDTDLRNHLTEESIKWTSDFSWEKNAQETVRILQKYSVNPK